VADLPRAPVADFVDHAGGVHTRNIRRGQPAGIAASGATARVGGATRRSLDGDSSLSRAPMRLGDLVDAERGPTAAFPYPHNLHTAANAPAVRSIPTGSRTLTTARHADFLRHPSPPFAESGVSVGLCRRKPTVIPLSTGRRRRIANYRSREFRSP